MAKLITDTCRKSIKTMVQISQCARVLPLMPTGEDFALRFIGDMRIIARRVNDISIRINEILDRYSSIPGEFLLEGFDEILDKLNNVNDYTKFAIQETSDLMSTTVMGTRELTNAIGNATSTKTSAVLQVGGGVSSPVFSMGSELRLAMTGNDRRKIVNNVVDKVLGGKVDGEKINSEIDKIIENKINNTASRGIESSDNVNRGLDGAIEWIDDKRYGADKIADNSIGDAIKKVERAKREVEEKIQRVRETFRKFTEDFDDAFGFISGKKFAEDALEHVSNSAYDKNSPVYDSIGDVTGELSNLIKNFNIGKVITSIGGIVVGAGAATLAMDLLPSIDVDRMLRNVIGGVDTRRIDKMAQLQYNKYYESEPDLLEVPDVPWRLTKDDLEKYNADGYEKYLEEYAEENDKARSEILEKMQKATTRSEIKAVLKENKEKMKENKSALKAMRKVRRDAIKAKQIEKYKGFLSIELDYLKRDCLNMKNDIKNEWDSMMAQYKAAIEEIKNFFTVSGCGGNETVDRCCDRINDDATQIVELCKALVVELTNVCTNVGVPYAVGFCCDMPVHKVLEFIKDMKFVMTFLKNVIRLGIDIISQLTILAKLIFGGLQSLADIINKLKELIGVDKILDMIDNTVGMFQPMMIEAKILIENGISPIYYNETEDFENRVNAIEEALDKLEELKELKELKGGGTIKSVKISTFRYSDDPNARNKHRKIFGGVSNNEDEIEDWLEELEDKGDREIVAYRSPILNDDGDEFAGWIFYHAYAYDNMKKSWSSGKKRRRNKVIRKASKKNKLSGKRLSGGVAQLKRNKSFGYYNHKGRYVANKVTGYDAYFWYIKWTNDPTDCVPDFENVEYTYDENGNVQDNPNFKKDVVSPIQTTSNGSLVQLKDGRRVFVEGEIVKSGDFVNVDGKKYRVE